MMSMNILKKFCEGSSCLIQIRFFDQNFVGVLKLPSFQQHQQPQQQQQQQQQLYVPQKPKIKLWYTYWTVQLHFSPLGWLYFDKLNISLVKHLLCASKDDQNEKKTLNNFAHFKLPKSPFWVKLTFSFQIQNFFCWAISQNMQVMVSRSAYSLFKCLHGTYDFFRFSFFRFPHVRSQWILIAPITPLMEEEAECSISGCKHIAQTKKVLSCRKKLKYLSAPKVWFRCNIDNGLVGSELCELSQSVARFVIRIFFST